MIASNFNTVIARCMTDPNYLREFLRTPADRLHDHPQLSANAELLSQLDRRRVEALAGLITKVQNNHTYALIPFTRKLLRQCHLEMPLFVAYHSTHQWARCRPHLSRVARTAIFLRFLDGWLAGLSDERRTLLRDVLRHERICWQMAQWRQAEYRCPHARNGTSEHLTEDWLDRVPRTAGFMRIGRFSNNPLTVSRLLTEGGGNAFEQRTGDCVIAYWADSYSGACRHFRISPEVAELLQAMDGQTPFRSIVESVVGEYASEADFSGIRDLFNNLLKNRLATTQAKACGGAES